jgi:hypothetical protein
LGSGWFTGWALYLSLPRFRGHPNTAILAGGEVDVQENAKGTQVVYG